MERFVDLSHTRGTSDQKEYAYIRLGGKLEAMLISTSLLESKLGSSSEQMAAASVCVNVGSFADPQDAQGLAHFLGGCIILLA